MGTHWGGEECPRDHYREVADRWRVSLETRAIWREKYGLFVHVPIPEPVLDAWNRQHSYPIKVWNDKNKVKLERVSTAKPWVRCTNGNLPIHLAVDVRNRRMRLEKLADETARRAVEERVKKQALVIQAIEELRHVPVDLPAKTDNRTRIPVARDGTQPKGLIDLVRDVVRVVVGQ